MDLFGISVSVSGGYAIVGAWLNDGNTIDSGSAYVYEQNGAAWNQVAKLTDVDGAMGDSFGISVAISGDYAVVGASGDDDNGTQSGSVFVYQRSGSAWNQVAKLTASDSESYSMFGNRVSIDGDYAVIGAPRDDDSGSAYVFQRIGSAWNQVAKLTPSDGQSDDEFGTAVSISGDYAVVGALRGDGTVTDAGAAYVFQRSGSAWNQVAKLTADSGAPYTAYAFSVSISGNWTIVGAHGHSASGSAFMYHRNGSVWTQVHRLTPSDGAADDYFGDSVAISGDYAIVGANRDDDDGSRSGSVYVFRYDGVAWNEISKLTADDANTFDGFGYPVSIDGNYAVIGAFGDDDNGYASGSAYVFMVPEPATLSLLAIGGLVVIRRRRAKRP